MPQPEELIQSGIAPFLLGAPGESPLTRAALEAFRINTLPLLQQQMALQGLGQSPALAQVMGDSLATTLPSFIQNDLANRFQAASTLQRGQELGLSAEQLALAQQRLGFEQSVATQQSEQERARLELQRQLGFGELGLGGQRLGLERELGFGELGLSGQRLGLERELGGQQLEQSAAQIAASIADVEAQRQLQAYGTAGQLMLGLANPYATATQAQQGQQNAALQGYGAAGELQRDTTQGALDASEMERLRLQGLAEGSTIGLFSSVLPPSLSQKSATSSGK